MEQVASAVPESTEETKFSFSFMLSFTPDMVKPGSLIINIYQDGNTAPALLMAPEGYEVPFETTSEVHEFLNTHLGEGKDWAVLSLFRVNKVFNTEDGIVWEYGDIKYVPILEDGFVADYQALFSSKELGVSVHRQDSDVFVISDFNNVEPSVEAYVVSEEHPLKVGDRILVIFNRDTEVHYIFNLFNATRTDDPEFLESLIGSLWVLTEQGMGEFDTMFGLFGLGHDYEEEVPAGFLLGVLADVDGTEYGFDIPVEHVISTIH